MNIKYGIISIVLLLGINANGQYASLLEQINKSIKLVENERYIISQSVEVENDDVPLLIVGVEVEDTKKNRTTYDRYIVNLAFLDERKVERKIKKKEMSLILNCAKGDFIRHQRDDRISYEDDMKLICADIDVLRDLEKQLKELITLGHQEWENELSIPNNFQELSEVIEKQTGLIQYEDELSIDQKLSFSKDHKDELSISGSIQDKNDTEEFEYSLSLADLDEKSAKINTDDDAVYVEYKNNGKGKYIRVKDKDGIYFTNKFKLYFNSPSDALRFNEYLNSAKGYADDVLKSKLKMMGEKVEGLTTFKDLIETKGDINRAISFNDECSALLNTSDDKKDFGYKFEWGDLDARSLKIDYDDDGQEIVLRTKGKNKFVQYIENESLKKYDDEVSFELKDVLSAKYVNELIPNIIEKCKIDLKPKDSEWLKNAVSIAPIQDRYDQKIYESDDACSYIFERYDNDKSKTETYEFNLYDVDAKSLDLDISKDRLTLRVKAKGNEKLFTYKNDDKDLEYTNDVKIGFTALSKARIAIPTLKKMIESCEE